jgi:hypothetical protein
MRMCNRGRENISVDNSHYETWIYKIFPLILHSIMWVWYIIPHLHSHTQLVTDARLWTVVSKHSWVCLQPEVPQTTEKCSLWVTTVVICIRICTSHCCFPLTVDIKYAHVMKSLMSHHAYFFDHLRGVLHCALCQHKAQWRTEHGREKRPTHLAALYLQTFL